MTRVVALSGGIGSGKSTVSRMLAELGATLIDADAIVHELQAPGTPLLAEIVEAFGREILRPDGALDRRALGAIVFGDDAARARLGAIVHPRVGAEMARRLREAVARGVPLVVLDIPLLFEGRRAGRGATAGADVDATILVWAPAQLQLERTMARDGCDAAEARRRIDAQMPIDEKKALADHVIDNSGPIEETRARVERLYAQLVGPQTAPTSARGARGGAAGR